ncbi:hypothetical protein MTO96_038381 [Rhipicephalus appendiculatus]
MVRHMNASQGYYEALTLPLNMAPSYPVYSYALQSLKVPMYMINSPLYYLRGTDAMFFGGLGYFLALNLVKALDKVGIRWHPNGTNIGFILSDDDRKAFEEKDGCLKDEGADTVFPDLPALEVAHSAMQDVSTSDLQDLGKDLSSAKVFFMTLCMMACSLPGFKSGFAISVSARQKASFLDPKYKSLQYEEPGAQEAIRANVQEMLDDLAPSDDESRTGTTQTTATALDILFDAEPRVSDLSAQFEVCLSEPQLGHSSDALKWWKDHEPKFPRVAVLAKKYVHPSLIRKFGVCIFDGWKYYRCQTKLPSTGK